MVIDVYSRMVTGLYIGFEGPSWESAKLALANTAENKVDFCKKYDIEISEEDWPVNGLPNCLLADKGEFLSANVETFCSSYGVRIENAVAGRGDAKGIVERKFRTIQDFFKPFSPGVVTPVISRKKGGFDYRKDAKYTIKEFTHIIILFVLWNNNYKTIQKYDRCEFIPPEIPAVPLSLWNWGLANLTGKLNIVEHKLLKINLMHNVDAIISNFGIHLLGCYYSCHEAMELGWFHRVENRKVTKVNVSYDTINTNNIYIRPNNSFNDYWVCNLTDRSRRFKDLTFWNVASIRKEEKRTDAKSNQVGCVKKGELLAKIEQTEQRAKDLQPDKLNINAKDGGQKIRQNKELERQFEREENSSTDNLNNPTNMKNELIKEESNIYSFPDLSDMLFEGESNGPE